MSKVLRVAKREYKATVRTKGFILGLVLAPVVMGGSAIVMALTEAHEDTTDRRVAVIDHTGAVGTALMEAARIRNAQEIFDPQTKEKTGPAYLVEVVPPDQAHPSRQKLELSRRVRRKDLRGFVEIGPDAVHPGDDPERATIAYYAENAAIDETRQWLGWPINTALRRQRLRDAGVGDAAMEGVFAWTGIESMSLVSVDPETGEIREARRSHEGEAVGIPIIMMMLMFLLVLMGAMPLLNSVMEEKNQRIAEVLLGSVRPFDFMMGKVLGGLGVSLTSSAVYVVGGVIAVKSMGLGEHVPYHVLPWFFGYLVLNILMLGSMLAAIGSACNDAKDAQSMTLPAMLPVMIPMFMLTPVIRDPSGALATWMSLFPPFTPLLMLLRQSTPGGVPAWQPWVGLVGILLFALLAVWAGGRIFRVGILMQGKTPRVPDLVRWAIRG